MPRSSTWRPGRSSATCRASRSTSDPTIRTTTRSPPWRDQIERRLHLLEPLRRRLRDVPFEPRPSVLDRRPRRSTSTSTSATPRCRRRAPTSSSPSSWRGSSAGRSTAAGRSGRPTSSRACPTTASAILTKVHHATIDGASGAELLTLMLDSDPEGDGSSRRRRVAPRPRPERRRGARPGDRRALVRKPGRALLLTTRTVRELGEGDPQPGAGRVRPNQARASLRGPLGARAEHRAGDASRRVSSSAQRRRVVAPKTPFNGPITPHRRFAFRFGAARRGQGDQDCARRDRERRRHGGLRGRAPHLPRQARRASRRAAHRDGAGVHPHGRRDREVDEPGLGDLRRACRPTRPIRWSA